MRVRHIRYLPALLLPAILPLRSIEAAPQHPTESTAAAAVAAGVQTGTPKPTTETARDPAVAAIARWLRGVTQTKLENGLRVILAPDVESPTVSVCVTYDVGSRNEGPGQSGFAHLFEHMMFQGSKNVGKGEHFQLVTARGGQLNGTTSSDRTNYFETLPSNELELELWLEADRMRWLDVSAANFENQRSVVKEEYRMRVENAAYRPALIELERLVFAGYPPYEHPTIGSMADLDAAKLEWVKDFHARYYAPNNAVLTIVGGFESAHAMSVVRKYFGPIGSVRMTSFQGPTIPELRTEEQRVTVPDVNAKTPAVLYGWRIPPSRDPDHFALEMAARVLADGDSSLLYEKLVRKRPLAREVAAYTYDHRGPDAFVITVELNLDSKREAVEGIVDQQLEQLAKSGPTIGSLSRAKQRLKSSFVLGLQSNQARATTLGEYVTFFGDPGLLAQDLDALLQVTPEQIARVVTRYLSKMSRTTVVAQPSTPSKTSASKESR